MPICEIDYPCGLLSDQQKPRIVERMTELLLQFEGLQDNSISRSICLLTINESKSVYVGGALSDEGKIVVKIFPFADAWTEEQTANIYAAIARIFIEEHPGTRVAKGNNVWCLIFPVTGNHFGVGGIPVTLEMTRALVAGQGKAS